MSPQTRLVLLTMRALYELLRYEVLNRVFGFKRMQGELAAQRPGKRVCSPKETKRIVDAVSLACCFYFKPVLCLQRSTVAARLLKKAGADARFVIGYRSAPFLSHAWVEVDGRVVNDSQAYKERLKVLCVV